MQFLQVMCAYEECNQRHYASLGSFKGKESYDVLKNTIVPHINAGIGLLNQHYCLIIEWDAGFDFMSVILYIVHLNN